MTAQDIQTKLETIFHDVFMDDSIKLNTDMTATDIEGWDSMTHINLIFACEQEFGIKFTLAEIAGLKTVGSLMDVIDGKVAG